MHAIRKMFFHIQPTKHNSPLTCSQTEAQTQKHNSLSYFLSISPACLLFREHTHHPKKHNALHATNQMHHPHVRKTSHPPRPLPPTPTTPLANPLPPHQKTQTPPRTKMAQHRPHQRQQHLPTLRTIHTKRPSRPHHTNRRRRSILRPQQRPMALHKMPPTKNKKRKQTTTTTTQTQKQPTTNQNLTGRGVKISKNFAKNSGMVSSEDVSLSFRFFGEIQGGV